MDVSFDINVEPPATKLKHKSVIPSRFIINRSKSQPIRSDMNPAGYDEALQCNSVIAAGSITRPFMSSKKFDDPMIFLNKSIPAAPALPYRDPYVIRHEKPKLTAKVETPFNIKAAKSILKSVNRDKKRNERRKEMPDENGNMTKVPDTFLWSMIPNII